MLPTQISREHQGLGRLFVDGDPADAGAGGPGGGAPPIDQTEILRQVVATQQAMAGTLKEVTESLQAIRASAVSRGEAPPPTGPEAVTDEQFEQALRDGDVEKQRKYHTYQRHLSDQRMNQLESVGLTAIGDLTRATTVEKMPLYDRFKKEVDEFIGNMPPAARLNPQVQKMAYEAVVGRHHNDLVKEEREAALRSAAQNPGNAGAPGSGGGRSAGAGGGEAVPTVEELLGKEVADALAFRGISGDEQAKRMGYKDWAAYAALIKDQEGAAR